MREEYSKRNPGDIIVRSDSDDVDNISLKHDLMERRRKLYFLPISVIDKGGKRYMRNACVICVR